MQGEKVIVIGVNSLGEVISTCQNFTNDKAIETKMKRQYDCEDFYVLYPETVEELEDTLTEYYEE